MRAAVLGAGSWGTTFAQVLCDAGTPAVLYSRRPEIAKAVNSLHENPEYLPGVALTPALRATADPEEALDGATAALKARMIGLVAATSLEAQHEARRLAGQIAVTLAAALLVRHAPDAVSSGFCASRLGPQALGGPGAPFGTLPARLDLAAITDRARAEAAGGAR